MDAMCGGERLVYLARLGSSSFDDPPFFLATLWFLAPR